MPHRLARIDAARSEGWEYYTSPAVVMNLDLEYLGVRGRGRALRPLQTPILIHAATAAKMIRITDRAVATGSTPRFQRLT